MSDAILVLNAGSSTIKVGVFERSGQAGVKLLCKGLLDDHGAEPRLQIKDAGGGVLFDGKSSSTGGEDGLLNDLLNWADSYLAADALRAIGHRVVHGGPDYVDPVQLDEEVLNALAALAPLAPLHQDRCLAPVRAIKALRPDLPQIACFDTAFHHRLPPRARRFAVSRNLEALGLRRYGFHGLSYDYIARRLAELSPMLAAKRTVVAHLGSGASLCAMRNGVSVDTTMGLTPLDGLVMGTRCGAIDPGVLLYLQEVHGLDAEELGRTLYEQSGLLGLSGISADMRVLLASDDPRAAEAVDLFVGRAVREIAAMASSLGGLECLVFTAGIGEHGAAIRGLICAELNWLGVMIDPQKNASSQASIAAASSNVDVRVIPTSEETTIARQCAELLASAGYQA